MKKRALCTVFLLLFFTLFNFTNAQNSPNEPLAAFGPTRPCDHLWMIARLVKNDCHASLQQIMLAILKNNPKAFYANNINGLMKDHFLTLPILESASLVPKEDAIKIVNEQNKTWSTYAKEQAQNPTFEYLFLKKRIKCRPTPKTTFSQRFYSFNNLNPILPNATQETSAQAEATKQETAAQQAAAQEAILNQKITKLTKINTIAFKQIDTLSLEKQKLGIANKNLKNQNKLYEQNLTAASEEITGLTQQNLELNKNITALQTDLNDKSMQLDIEKQKFITAKKNYFDHPPFLVICSNFFKKIAAVSLQHTIILPILIILILLIAFIVIAKKRARKNIVDNIILREPKIENSDAICEKLTTTTEILQNRNNGNSNAPNNKLRQPSAQDLLSISGESVITTQLNLAKTYIEMGEKELARSILLNVIKTGSTTQKGQANDLLKEIL